jgi:ABC-type sugar transport system permease subunit
MIPLLKIFLVTFLISSFISILICRFIFNDASNSSIISSLFGGVGGGIALVLLTKRNMKKKFKAPYRLSDQDLINRFTKINAFKSHSSLVTS